MTITSGRPPACAVPRRPSLAPGSAPYWLSGALIVVSGLAALIGLLVTDVFHDPAVTVGNPRGTGLALLLVALPVMGLSMRVTARGGLLGQLGWLGSTAYLVYNGVLFSFGTTFNRLFLLYVAMLGLATWTLILLLARADRAGLAEAASPRLPVRALGAYLIVAVSLFALLWLRDIVPAVLDGTRPASLDGLVMLTNPVQVLDLAFSVPAAVLAGVLLWRRAAWGYVLAGTLLVMLAIESASITIDQLFGHVADPTAPLATVPLFAAMTLLGVGVLVVLRRGFDLPGETSTRPAHHA